MSNILFLMAAVIAVGLLYVTIPIATESFLRFRGKRVITCPETRRAAAVEVDALHAALGATVGCQSLRIAECSRWPSRRDCDQECLEQIESAPEQCLFRTYVAGWYKGKACVFCQRGFEHIPWAHHRPALMNSTGELVEWESLRDETMLATLSTHRPVCWDCFVTESFRNRHRDLVVERPARWSPPGDNEGRPHARPH